MEKYFGRYAIYRNDNQINFYLRLPESEIHRNPYIILGGNFWVPRQTSGKVFKYHSCSSLSKFGKVYS
jgi:hypothetical protein